MKRELLACIQEARRSKRPVALVTDLEDGAQSFIDGDEMMGELSLSPEAMRSVRAAITKDASGPIAAEPRLFVQVFNPPLRLVIVGAVHIAQTLLPMAQLAGYAVTLVDPRRAWASPERFPSVSVIESWPDEALQELKPDHRTAVVTLTHDPKLDDPALAVALRSKPFYIGALGSTRTHAKRLQRLQSQGFSEAELARIHGPAGLAIGARSPAEIALAVMAQMTEVLRTAPAEAEQERVA